ncbi:MAG: TetR/AcrR family transcriptional regulator [Xanthobacteraceae bacterium]|nr:TetR/AcrR family transcriptional regulator [Xanthobacteraceae bacterium]
MASNAKNTPQARSADRRAARPASPIGLRGSVVRNPEQRQEQRRQILAAAGRVFARKGYGSATMDDIAAEMGASKGILYYQFQSKQDLIVETRLEASGSAAVRLEAIAALPLPVHDRMERALRDLIATNFEELSRHVTMTPVTMGVDRASVTEVRAIERRYEAALVGLLREGIAAGVFVAADVKVTAFTLIRACLSPAWWYREGGGATQAEVADIVTGILMRGLCPPSRT